MKIKFYSYRMMETLRDNFALEKREVILDAYKKNIDVKLYHEM